MGATEGGDSGWALGISGIALYQLGNVIDYAYRCGDDFVDQLCIAI